MTLKESSPIKSKRLRLSENYTHHDRSEPVVVVDMRVVQLVPQEQQNRISDGDNTNRPELFHIFKNIYHLKELHCR